MKKSFEKWEVIDEIITIKEDYQKSGVQFENGIL